MSRQFVEDSTIGARVLGIYGGFGLGKTMLAKALHDYFYGEFLGKVCYVDLRKGSRAKRQKWMLKMLCGVEKDVVDCLGVDVEKGLMQMKSLMKRDRLCLVLDNISYDALLLQEVQDYLRMGFHLESRIVITSSSKAILDELLPNVEFYTPMPTLTVEEASALFLKRAAPMKAISELTIKEQNILGICMQTCWFHFPEGGSYHPVALTALADFFSRLGRGKGDQILLWKDRLEKERDLVTDVLKSSKDLFGILGLQFSTFDFSEKLIFLDLAIYSISVFGDSLGGDFGWLCRLHDESSTIIEKKFLDLRRSGMIDFDLSKKVDCELGYDIDVPPLYQEFAKWYATDHNVNGVRNALGVFRLGGMNWRDDSLVPMKSWSDLIRLCISPMTDANVRLVASKRMQELRNLVVLQLDNCSDLTTLNLDGLDCLRDLGLFDLPKLVMIILSGNSSKDEYVGIYNSLQHVRLVKLGSLVHMPNFRPCTSLCAIYVESCVNVINLECVDCPCVKDLKLDCVYPNHFERLLEFDCLQSVKHLSICALSDVDYFRAYWTPREDESHTSEKVTLKGEGPCAKLLEELCLLLCGSNNMICTLSENRNGTGWFKEMMRREMMKKSILTYC